MAPSDRHHGHNSIQSPRYLVTDIVLLFLFNFLQVSDRPIFEMEEFYLRRRDVINVLLYQIRPFWGKSTLHLTWIPVEMIVFKLVLRAFVWAWVA